MRTKKPIFLLVTVLMIISLLGVTAPVSAQALSRYYVYFPLYLKTGNYVVPVSYIVPEGENLIEDALQSLIAGLSDKAGMMIISLPQDTKILGADVKDALCTLDFSEEIKQVQVGAGGESAVLSAILETVFQFPEIDEVQILIEGKKADSLAGHVDISKPFSKENHVGNRFVTFEDARQHWAGGYITLLHSMDVLDGFEDGLFRPDRTLTRAEFLKIIVEALEIDYDALESMPFEDIESHWSKPFVEMAVKTALIDSDDYGKSLYPDEPITREEMAYILLKAADIKGVENTGDESISFEDASLIDDKYLSAVEGCVARGLIEGFPDGTFKPTENLTRAQACTTVGRVLGMRGGRALVLEPRLLYEHAQDVFVLGAAQGFEGTVNFNVKSGEDVVLPENFTTSTNGLGWGIYGFCIRSLLLKPEETLELSVYIVNMEDGSHWDPVTIELN